MMQRKKKRSLETPDENWLVSYADMVTLLLYLFVILYALAVLNKGELEKSLKEFSNSFVNTGDIESIFDSSNNGKIPQQKASKTSATYSQVNQYIKNNKLSDKIKVKNGENGITLQLQVNILFNSGNAVIKPENKSVLNKISDLLSEWPNDIIIKGYTDNNPINSGYYQSNWELSSDRAVKILRYFTEDQGLDPKRFQAIGFGQYKPIASNNTPNGREKNRRVEIFIVGNNSSSN